ncbi:MAG TPA: YCF48-related protein, partial [Ignavibacteria bacterium]
KYISKILDILIALVLLLFFSSFGFRDGRTSGWYQQFFPNMNGSTITNMTFLDSLTGFAVTNSNSSNQSYILKTTNGGDNWNIQITTYPNFNKISFVDQNNGFASAYTDALFKTTNGGSNWFAQSNNGIFPNDMAVLNIDTILYVRSDIIDGGVYRTTNGGLIWQALGQVGGSGQPSEIYMFDKNIGFNCGTSGMKKTTNGGVNWFLIPNEVFLDIQLIDSSIGWRCNGDIKKTTDGGLTWTLQQLPQILENSMLKLSISSINKL